MRTCICTIIKNEHQYLDEWIQYHLRLGIDYIFIFEDIDSDSHDEICGRYENVTLKNVNTVLTIDEQKEAKVLKYTRKYNIQHFYFRRILNYIKNNFVVDWCFVIDPDEFITLQGNDTLSHVLDLYCNYDAFIARWKCYGANGNINKPDYTKTGVVETYTKKANDDLICGKQECFMKTCWNMHKYKDEFFFNQHHPSNEANWVNTDFQVKSILCSYSNIYIRHYITKSFEEYIWKLKTRGYPWGVTRDYEFFFKVNPDLLDKKDSLIEEMKKEYLIVLPYKQSGKQGSELELALASWKKFCNFKYHFVVIGDANDDLKKRFDWAEFIKCDSLDIRDNQYNPHLDIQHKMQFVQKKYEKIYDGFIYITDDNYAVKNFYIEDILTTHYHSMSFEGKKNAPTSYWSHDKWKTRQILDREKLPHINYVTHYPCYFDFKKVKRIWQKYNMAQESYVLEDLYFNNYEHDKPILDSEIRLGIWDYNIYKKEFKRALENPKIKFMCNSVEGWSKELENSLKELYVSDEIETPLKTEPK